MRILFTDGIGAAVLHNGKPAPANRASNWKPSPMPVGDSANRQSDGALTLFRYRDDFGCTFDLTQIPVRPINQNLIEINGDIAGAVGGTPTGMSSSGPTNIVAIVDALGVLTDGRPRGEYGFNGLIAKHIGGGASTGIELDWTSAIIGHLYQFTAAVFIPSSSTASDLLADFEGGVSGTTTMHADFTKRDTWQVLTVTATATATAIGAVLRLTGSGGVAYSDLWSVLDLTAPNYVRLVDIADRLAYWLNNGGTCEVDTGDYDGNIYATCGVAPGTTIAPPTLSDKKNLEYTLSLSLINLAGSPARMRCHYA